MEKTSHLTYVVVSALILLCVAVRQNRGPPKGQDDL